MVLHGKRQAMNLQLLCQMFWQPLHTNLAVAQPFTQYWMSTSYAQRHFLCYFSSGDSLIPFHKTVHIFNCSLNDNHMHLTRSWRVISTASSIVKIFALSEYQSAFHTLHVIRILHSTIDFRSTQIFCC